MAKKPKLRADGRMEKVMTIGGKKVHFYGKNESEILRKIRYYKEKEDNGPLFKDVAEQWHIQYEKEVEYNPYSSLSSDRKTAMRMMRDIEEITKKLPGLDCGSCGAPTCMAFAEDIVKNETSADECTVILKRILREHGLHQDLLCSEFESLRGSQSERKEKVDDGK